ncbi:FK506-binding protein-like [Myiozetetes cayanensis]|uniref:FK506-binding protein-like n=1 Tax=Myiozetetes cayanensis TaxID=478635 RepID=UPI00215E2123|nr:FK506-binding protein-like [Myiozetetes cayanensis]
MDGVEPANGESAVQQAANEGGDALEAAANEQRAAGDSSNRDGGSLGAANEELGMAGAASNGNAPLQSSSNEEKGSSGSSNEQSTLRDLANEDRGGQHGPANEEEEPHDLTNEGKGPQQPANADAEHEASANEIAAAHDPANKEAAPGAAANENSALSSTTNGREEPSDPSSACSPSSNPPSNQHAALPDPANGVPLQQAEPSNELGALAAPPTRTRDQWDWSLEEAWLRAPEGEGLEAWGEGPEELDGEDEEDDDDEEEEEDDEEGQQWWHSPDGAISKQIVRRGRGLSRPGPGSLCRVLLTPPPHPTGVPPGWGPPCVASNVGRWHRVRVGTGEGAWAAALDAALESMARGERARLRRAGPGAALGLRLGLPAAAAANAGKALALRPQHLEARFRRAVAAAAMADLEAAMADLAHVLRAQPGHAGARRELRRVRGAARERDARLARRLGRLFA